MNEKVLKIWIFLVSIAVLVNNPLLSVEFRVKLDRMPQENKKILSFASDLYLNKDYYRAITEFMRLDSYDSSNRLNGVSTFMAGECYCRAERWKEAIEQYEGFLRRFKNHKLYPDAQYKLLLCYYMAEDYKKAGDLYTTLKSMPGRHKWHDEIQYLDTLSLIYRQKWQMVINSINKRISEKTSAYTDKYLILNNEISKYDSVPRRSPKTAGLLSAIIPGAGQVYAKRPGDGIMALLLTGISAVTAINCHQNGAEFGAVVFGILGLSFYTANVYNAMNNAEKFNEENTRKFYFKLTDIAKDDKLFWSLCLEIDKDTNSLMLIYQY